MFLSDIFNYLIVIILGLIVGSFLNVVIWRLEDLKSIVNTRSHCPKCKKTLSWLDLIPVFSFIFLWGKCRYCKKEISLQYPLVEIGTALVFACIYYHFGFSFVSCILALVSSILIVIFVYDILKLQIADWLVIAAAALWLVYLGIDYFFIHNSLSIILNSLYGALALGGFLGLLVLISKEKWMGAGDIGLGAVLGAIVGWPLVLVSTFTAFIFGGVVGLVLISLKKKEMQSQLPFAPFLILGLFVALFWGEKILNWYMGGIF